MFRSVIAIALLFTWACSSDPATVAEHAQAIEQRVWSPYCPGRLLTDCTTTQARELRTAIQARLEGGESPDSVLRWIRTNHGDEALAAPAMSGSGLVVWLLPVASIAMGAILIIGVVRRWTRVEPASPEPTLPPSTQGARRRLRDDVRREL